MHQRNKQKQQQTNATNAKNKQMQQIHQETNTQMEQTNKRAQINTYELKSRHLVLKFKNQVSLPLAVTTMIQSVSESFKFYGN